MLRHWTVTVMTFVRYLAASANYPHTYVGGFLGRSRNFQPRAKMRKKPGIPGFLLCIRKDHLETSNKQKVYVARDALHHNVAVIA